MATGDDNQTCPFQDANQALQFDRDRDRLVSVPSLGAMGLMQECTDCTEESGGGRTRLLIGGSVTDISSSSVVDPGKVVAEKCHVAPTSSEPTTNGNIDRDSTCACSQDTELKEVRKDLEKLQTEVRAEVMCLKEVIEEKNRELEEKNKELSKKNDELEQTKEEAEKLRRKLDWKDEQVEHERESKQWLKEKIARLEEEKDQLQDTVKQLKKEMDDMRQKIQVMNNEKASIKDIIEIKQMIERQSYKGYTKPGVMLQMFETPVDLVTNITSLMQKQDDSNSPHWKPKEGTEICHKAHSNRRHAINYNSSPQNVYRTTSDSGINPRPASYS